VKDDRLPIEIVADGTLYSGEFMPRQRALGFEAGLRVYTRFLLLTKAVRPTYAAITVEVSLPTPSHLRTGYRSRAFGSFYISEVALGPRNLRRIADAFAGAYIENVGEGLYISTHAPFNPSRIDMSSEKRLSATYFASEIIGKSLAG
jgi:hypothetical protein